MRKIVAEKLVDQISDWGHRGLISSEQLAILQSRYSSDVTLGSILLRWLGVLAVCMLGLSVVGLIGLALGNVALYVAPIALTAVACFTWVRGTKMAADPEQNYPVTGAVLVTVALLAGFVSLVLSYELFVGAGNRAGMLIVVPYTMLIVGAIAFFTAYRFGLRWPLTLGVLLVFHGIGNLHGYSGHGNYFLGIRDERLTFAIAIISLVFGIWHEEVVEKDLNRSEVGFGQVFIVFGLLYVNLCFWILSLYRGDLVAVLVFTAMCVAQIVLGGKHHDGRFIGFGIVFLSINIYTRLFENFWDELSKGVFFLASGTIALIVGIAFEWRSKKLKSEVAE